MTEHTKARQREETEAFVHDLMWASSSSHAGRASVSRSAHALLTAFAMPMASQGASASSK